MGKQNKNNAKRKLIDNDLFLYRKKRRYSQRDIAYLLGHKSSAHISDYETGKRMPSLKTALKLAVILSTQVDGLFEEMREELKQEIQIRRQKLYAKKHGN